MIVVGFSRERTGRDGKPRYTAYYKDIKGRERSAGTFTSKKRADKAWQSAESRIAQGRVGDPARGRQTFRRYVEQTWLPNHQMEAKTRETYTSTIYRYLLPEFGPMRMIDILPEHVRSWVAMMQANEVGAPTINKAMSVLSAICTTALNDQVTFLHPCKGVKTPTVARKPLTIITPEQFDTIYRVLSDTALRLLVETAIESGLRWGELSELRVQDLDVRSRILTVTGVPRNSGDLETSAR